MTHRTAEVRRLEPLPLSGADAAAALLDVGQRRRVREAEEAHLGGEGRRSGGREAFVRRRLVTQRLPWVREEPTGEGKRGCGWWVRARAV